METTKATKISDLTGEKLKSLLTMVGNRKEVSPETRRIFNRLMAQAVTLGFGNVIDRMRGRKDSSVKDNWETMSPEKRRELLSADLNRPQEDDDSGSDGGQPEEENDT